MSKKLQSRIGERSAVSGRFAKDGTAKKRPNTTVREHIPLPGKGTAKQTIPGASSGALQNVWEQM